MENTERKVGKSFARQFADYRNILLDLIDNTHVPRSVKEKEKIAQLELDGLAYMKSILEPTTVVNKDDFTYDDVAKTYFIKIGLELERKEQLKKNNANVLENTQAKLDLVALTEGLEKHLGLIPEFFLGTPSLAKKPKPEPKLEEKPKVKLNETFITQELTTQALREADTKEIGLGSGAPIANGQVGASLVVDLDPKKIESTIMAYEKLLNPTDKNDEVKDKKESKNESKLKNPFAAPSLKPSPEDTKKKKKKNGKDIKPLVKTSAGDLTHKIAALRQTVLKNQENAPIVVEQERFETLVKPEAFQISKNKSIERMLSMQQATRPGITPNSIENAFGAEERKVKAKLK